MNKKKQLLILLSIITTFVYITWRIFFTLPLHSNYINLTAAIIMLAAEFVGALELFIHFYTIKHYMVPDCPQIQPEVYPDVDIFIATYNEPVSLLYKTVNACNHLDYPDKSKVHIYLCDDGNRPEMKELANRLNVTYLCRSDRSGSKAGNLNNALKNSTSPYILTLDADMIPMHQFLTKVIPYFYTEGKKIGFVQTPQNFYNPDLFQFNLNAQNKIPNEQDYFFRNIELCRNGLNSVIYAGSNTIISREALYEIGGFYTESITEDIATGLLIQSKGYTCYAIDEVYASGLSPNDFKSLIKQRERWGRGCLQTFKKLHLFRIKGLNFKQKLSYFSSIIYWYSSVKKMIYLVFPLLFAYFGIVIVRADLKDALIVWAPMYIISKITISVTSSKTRNSRWSNIYDTILFHGTFPGIVKETLGISKSHFSVTRKDNSSDNAYIRRAAIPFYFYLVLNVMGFAGILIKYSGAELLSYSLVMFWIIVNTYYLIMTLFFLKRKQQFRHEERFNIMLHAKVTQGNTTLNTKTDNISDNGLSLTSAASIKLYMEQPVHISVSNKLYSSTFSGRITHIQQEDNGYKYGIKITEIDDVNYQSWLCLIYDRVPPMQYFIDGKIHTIQDLVDAWN